jgi:hypothetical protein
MGWLAFLDTAPAADHAVQCYVELDELAASVGRFLDAGARVGEPGLLIAMSEHRPAFEAELELRGHDARELEKTGLITWHDADDVLAAFMDDDMPSAERFEQVVGAAVDEIARRFPDKTIRAFGEMVDLLARRGLASAAIALEELWNGLAERRRFALLCAYELDVFDLETQRSALPEIFRVHTHQRPVADTPRLAAAVDRALTEAVGPAAAAQIYLRVAQDVPRSELPRAQAVLAWLSERDPSTARRVLSAARIGYAGAA